MAEDKHKRMADLLFSYELGLLGNDELREFELYLLENDDLMTEARSFEEAVALIRTDPEIRREMMLLENKQKGEETAKRRKTKITPLLPTLAAAAIFLILLVVQPWEIKFSPTKEVIAEENRLAVLDFDNLADPLDTARLGQICANLLITDLSESEYLQIVSPQRIVDILDALTIDTAKIGIDDYAIDVAREAGAKWVLTGKILQIAPTIVLSTQLIDVASGDILASREIKGEAGEDIFAIIDRLSMIIKQDLTLPEKAMAEPDRMIAEFTTHSQKAYFYYLEGIDYYTKAYYFDAKTSFERVLEHDSAFAMAHYYLARMTSGDLREGYIASADEYADRTGIKDKFIIESFKAFIRRDYESSIEWLRMASLRFPDDKTIYFELAVRYYNLYDFEEAIQYLKKAIHIDPNYKSAVNQLAYTYNRVGNVESALEMADRYIEIAPDEANPYDSKGDICTRNGLLEEAIISFEKALEIKPNFYNSQIMVALLYIHNGDYDKVAELIKTIASSPTKSHRSASRSLEAAIYLRQAKFDSTMISLERGIATDYKEQTGSSIETEIRFKLLIKAYMYLHLKDKAQSIKAADEFVEINRRYAPNFVSQWRQFQAQIYAELGSIDEALEIVKELKADLDSLYPDTEHYPYYYGIGAIEFARGNYDEAIVHFENLTGLNNDFYAFFMLARSLHEAGEYDRAIEIYEPLLTKYNLCWPLYMGCWGVKLHYYLGMAYEAVGRNDDAINRYEFFVDKWNNADRAIEEIEDAKKRLDRLKNNI